MNVRKNFDHLLNKFRKQYVAKNQFKNSSFTMSTYPGTHGTYTHEEGKYISKFCYLIIIA